MGRAVRGVYLALAGLLFLWTVALFFFAAFGAFSAGPREESFAIHRALGHMLIAAAVLTTLVAALARAPRRLIGLTGLVGVLAIIQFLISTVAGAVDDGGSATAAAAVFGLHALGGLLTMGVARTVFLRARQLFAAPAAIATGAATEPVAP